MVWSTRLYLPDTLQCFRELPPVPRQKARVGIFWEKFNLPGHKLGLLMPELVPMQCVRPAIMKGVFASF